jgi:hypothetical protein
LQVAVRIDKTNVHGADSDRPERRF